MKPLFVYVGFAVVLSGCGIGGVWMNGDPSVGKNLKPYGAHWVKDGMTRESRLDDIVACGATRDLTIHFPIESIQKLPGYQYTETDEIRRAASNDVLEDRWRICMKSKGYSYVDKCDIRCL